MTKKIPTYFQPIDPHIMDDPAIAQTGAMGEFLYIRGLLYIRRNRSYGQIPKRSLGDVGDGIPNAKKHAQALVDVGLWIEDGQYWAVKNWTKWNMTEEEVKKRATIRSNAGKIGGHTSKHSPDHPSETCSLCWEAGWNGEAQVNA